MKNQAINVVAQMLAFVWTFIILGFSGVVISLALVFTVTFFMWLFLH